MFVLVADPVGAGFVESLARPGGNITGFTNFEYTIGGKWLELLKEISPRLKRVAVLRESAISAGAGQFGAISAAAHRFGVDLRPVDVRDPAQVDAMITRTVDAFGQADILVNNAAGNFIARAEDLSPNGWNAVIGIVLNGSFYCSRAAGRHMIKQGSGGSIVSILANYTSSGSAGTIHSASAKAGVLAMTRTLAIEWARDGINVNALVPGVFPTEINAAAVTGTDRGRELLMRTPMRRFGRAEEIVGAAVFLASDVASYITGHGLAVDGGFLASAVNT